MTARIYRYEVPVDNQWHQFALQGDPLAVGPTDGPDLIEFWTWHNSNPADREWKPPARRQFIVVGAGHPLPANAGRHWGVAIWKASDSLFGGAPRLVWHLIEEASS